MTLGYRICPTCKENKHYSDFHRKNGRCKTCMSEYNRNRYKDPTIRQHIRDRANFLRKSDPDYVAKNYQRSLDYYTSLRGRSKTLIKGAERRAKIKNEYFNLSFEHIYDQILNGKCCVTGIKFVFAYRSIAEKKNGMHPFAPSIDKINCKLPYTDENSRVVIWQYNMMKGNLTDEEIFEICLALVNKNVTR